MKPFKSFLPGFLLVLLAVGGPLVTGFVGLIACVSTSKEEGRETAEHDSNSWTLSAIEVMLVMIQSLSLGVVIFTHKDNLSLSFLVITNLHCHSTSQSTFSTLKA